MNRDTPPPHDSPSPLTPTAHGVCVRVKVVPGASRTKLAGLLGDRLKITVAAAPQAGRANRAVIKLLANLFGLSDRDTVIRTGHSQPLKTVELISLDPARAATRLRQALSSIT